MRRLLISTAIIALLGCDQAEDSNDTTTADGMTPASTSGSGGSTAADEATDGTARTDVIALAQEAGEATAEQCPNGGVVLNLGVDTNGNGMLDDDEVTGDEVVCNGRDGESCSLTDNGNGTATLECDGNSVLVPTVDRPAPQEPGAVSHLGTPGGTCEIAYGNTLVQSEPFVFETITYDAQGRISVIEITDLHIQNDVYAWKTFEYNAQGQLERTVMFNSNITQDPYAFTEYSPDCHPGAAIPSPLNSMNLGHSSPF